MKIPFKSIYSDYSNLSIKTLNIGLETGVLKTPHSGNRPSGMNNQPGGMSGGGGSGGRSGGGAPKGGGKGGGPSGGTPSFSKIALSSPTKIWIKNIHFANTKIYEK
ncbi:MAG: hypothetical protein GQ564_19880 [Bacteroidales bacterium]|nr:hypothetical protein [Bacteroidales bacterium]